MKTNILKFASITAVCFAITISSCKKKEEETPEPTPTPTPAATTPSGAQPLSPSQVSEAKGADGVLVAVKTVTTTNVAGQSIETALGLGVAYFTETAGDFNAFADAGEVTLNKEKLEIQQNTSYLYKPGTTDPTGISFSSGASWEVAGKGGTPGFKADFTQFPKTPVLKSEVSITKSNGYTLEFETRNSADTVLCTIYSGSGYKMKGMKANSGKNTVEFTADDLKDLATSADKGAMIQIALVNFQNYVPAQSTKKYVLINETVTTELATIK